MAYLLIFSFVYTYSFLVQIKQKNYKEFLSAYIPIVIVLILTLGLQDGVGTDYYSYYSLADGSKSMGWIAGRSEILFIWLVELVIRIGKPQLLFVLAGSIQIVFLTLIAYEIKKIGYKTHEFFFLYFTLSLTFFNQFNGIRQYIAVYIVVYAFLKLIENNRLIFCLLIIAASLFHSSSIFFLPFVLVGKLLEKKMSTKLLISIIGVLIVLTIVDVSKYIELLLSYTPYKNYIGSSYLGRLSFQGIITKIPKIVIVLFSSYIVKKRDLVKKEIQLLNLSYISIFILIMSFSSTLIWRFYQYVDLMIIFPVLMLFSDEKYKMLKIIISIILFAMLIIKIIVMPRGEYLYKSIVF